eukprot:scaffold8018_cov109-Isochrysis_galbana.AAC.2
MARKADGASSECASPPRSSSGVNPPPSRAGAPALWRVRPTHLKPPPNASGGTFSRWHSQARRRHAAPTG